MSPPLRSTLCVADGSVLALHDWSAAAGVPRRGQVLLVHGLGEHAGRYAHLAQWLSDRGYAVRGYDLYGHGHSSGPRGHLARDLQHLEHLAELASATRAPGAAPLLVLGHSLGGLIAAAAVAHGLLRADGLVLSSPALAVDMARWQRAVVGWLPRLAPDLTLRNGLQPRYLSHDPAVVAAYEADPLVHDRICARLGGFVANEGTRVIARAARWPLRTLLLYAGDDRLVSPRGSRAFAQAAAPAGPRVRSECFAALYHEIFNEPDAAPVFAALAAWLDGAD
jgi:alpha-beta hydrolase superfamily lysophospholipase